jgi:RNA polymerase I-specific transcription initiation factor RRN3
LVTGSSTPQLDTEDFSAEDIIAEGNDLQWLPGMKEIMTRNMHCRLNPLKVCSQEIVGEFAKIAHHLRFLYVFSVLESNKRVRLGQTFSYYGSGGPIDIGRRETAWDRQKGDSHHQLEAYFPFDPYHLPKSKRWVENDYNEWELPRGLRTEDDEDEDEVEIDGEDEGEEGVEAEYESDVESVPEEAEGLVPTNTIQV